MCDTYGVHTVVHARPHPAALGVVSGSRPGCKLSHSVHVHVQVRASRRAIHVESRRLSYIR